MAQPKILYITASANDYLADSLLHGLRCLLGRNVVDFPRCPYMDVSLNDATKATMHGRGFTLYGKRPDEEGASINREHVWERAADGEFDLVIFSSIPRQYELLLGHSRTLANCRVVLIEGEDSPTVFPWSGTVLRRGPLKALRAAAATRGKTRFMRERPDALLPKSMRRRPLSALAHLASIALIAARPPRKIAFSIPRELIVSSVPPKTRLLFDHVVDADTAKCVHGASTAYIYDTENAYLAGLRTSRFAVTRKRAGWDCMRHYEIAASGCVPCFRFLDRKPQACAPFGLDSSNCITYEDPIQLLDRLRSMPEDDYYQLAIGAIEWAMCNSTVARASQFLHELGWSAGASEPEPL